jgi:hypothetical protein
MLLRLENIWIPNNGFGNQQGHPFMKKIYFQFKMLSIIDLKSMTHNTESQYNPYQVH